MNNLAIPHRRAGTAPTLNAEAYRRLEEMIVTLELEPGCVVSEAVLSERIGIGTTPIREALQRLSREYLVQILPRRGVVVTAIDVRLQLQVLETRRELDRLIARSAARRASPRERREIGAVGERMMKLRKRGSLHDFLRLDDALNQQMAHAARNEIAANAVASLQAVSRRFWYFHKAENELSTAIVPLHAAVAATVAAADEPGAQAAAEALIDHLFAFARSTLPET
jgi:DNA-binding GntR family transcriptional regulator